MPEPATSAACCENQYATSGARGRVVFVTVRFPSLGVARTAARRLRAVVAVQCIVRRFLQCCFAGVRFNRQAASFRLTPSSSRLPTRITASPHRASAAAICTLTPRCRPQTVRTDGTSVHRRHRGHRLGGGKPEKGRPATLLVHVFVVADLFQLVCRAVNTLSN
jgi:hypothetical protein